MAKDTVFGATSPVTWDLDGEAEGLRRGGRANSVPSLDSADDVAAPGKSLVLPN